MKLIRENNKFKLVETNKYRRVKRALFGDPTGKIKSFAIISVQNPLGWKDSTEEEFKAKYLKWTENKAKYNKAAMDQAESSVLLHKIEAAGEQSLKYGGFKYVSIFGKYGNEERSYIIFNLALADAKVIARDFGQESFFYAKVGKEESVIGYYLTKNACKSYELIETTKTVSNEEEAEDFFSRYGLKFRINMREFGDAVPEITDQVAFEESLDEERTFKSRAQKRRQAYQNS